jgi:hypothetical protein
MSFFFLFPGQFKKKYFFISLFLSSPPDFSSTTDICSTAGMAMLEEARGVLLFDVTAPDNVQHANAAALAVSRGETALEKTLEDVQANQAIWSECCAKLGQAALALSDLKKAQLCGSLCASGLSSSSVREVLYMLVVLVVYLPVPIIL